MKKNIFSAMVLITLIALSITSGCEKDSNYYVHSGNAKFMAQKHKEALQDYNQAIKMDPKNSDAYFQRGKCHRQLKNYKKAIADFKMVVKLEPKTQRGKNAKRVIEELAAMK